MTIEIHRYKDRGPTSSSEYNDRVRNTADTYFSLLGRITTAESEVQSLMDLSAIEHVASTGLYETLLADLAAINASTTTSTVVPLFSDSIHRTSAGAAAEATSDVPLESPLSWDSDSGVIVLPFSHSESEPGKLSKLGFAPAVGSWVVDPAVETSFSFTSGVAVDVNSMVRALDHNDATAFIARTTSLGTRTLSYFVRVPADSNQGSLVNYLEIEPSPRSALTLSRICYSTTAGASLDDSSPEQWSDLWVNGDIDIPNLRFRAPQEGGANVQTKCGPRRYYFGERRVTAVKVVLETSQSYTIGATAEIILGIRHLDVGHVSFLTTGRITTEVALPSSVRRVSAVTPRIVNKGGNALDGIGVASPALRVFRKVDTAWTLYVLGTDIGAGNTFGPLRIETTLVMPTNGCTPVLSGFIVEHADS